MIKNTLIIGMVMLSTVMVWAQPQRGERPTPSLDKPDAEVSAPRGPQKLSERLQLTEEQQAIFEEKMVAFHKETQPMKNELNEKQARLKTLITSEKTDEKEIDSVIEEIGALETSLLKSRTKHHLEIRSMLDDKQKVMFDQHMSRVDRMGDRQGGPDNGGRSGGNGRNGGQRP